MVTSRQPNDCVIVAIANGTGLSYETVQSGLAAMVTDGSQLITRAGISGYIWIGYLKLLGWTRYPKVPRRGQDKITGIVRLYSSKYSTGHLTWMNRGLVYDIGANGMPIAEYQRRFRQKHIEQIWVPPTVTPKQDNPNWLDDFLSTL